MYPDKTRPPAPIRQKNAVAAGNVQEDRGDIELMDADEAYDLNEGDKVRILVGGRGDVEGKDEMQCFEAGEIVTIEDVMRDEDGVAVTIRAANGVVNVFDENDYCGKFPFNRHHPEVSSTLTTPRQ